MISFLELTIYNLEMLLWMNKCAAIGYKTNPPINVIIEKIPLKSPAIPNNV